MGQNIKVFRKIGEISVRNPGTSGNMGTDADPLSLQRGQGNGTGSHKGSGYASAEMTAAPVIFKTVVFTIGGVVCMPRPGKSA